MEKVSFKPDERKIYEIAKEFLLNKPLTSIKDMIAFINQRLKYNPNVNINKIERVIKSLIRNKNIQPGTKLIKENMLKLPSRKLIFDTIQDNEGINMSELIRIEGLGNHQVGWHLTFLEKFQCIRIKKFGNQKAYFMFNSDPDLDDIKYYLRHKKVINVIKYIEKNDGGANLTTIRKSLGMNLNTVKKYIDILQDLKIVEKVQNSDKIFYVINKGLLSNLRKKIKNK